MEWWSNGVLEKCKKEYITPALQYSITPVGLCTRNFDSVKNIDETCG
jgi:hypothetical protein